MEVTALRITLCIPLSNFTIPTGISLGNIPPPSLLANLPTFSMPCTIEPTTFSMPSASVPTAPSPPLIQSATTQAISTSPIPSTVPTSWAAPLLYNHALVVAQQHGCSVPICFSRTQFSSYPQASARAYPAIVQQGRAVERAFVALDGTSTHCHAYQKYTRNL